MTIYPRAKCFLFLLVVFLLPLPLAAAQTPFPPFIETFPNGRIDWRDGWFYGTGTGYPHLNGGSRARALKVAQAGALGAILQIASGLRVDDKKTLADLEKEKAIIRISGLVHYEPHERKWIKNTKQPHYQVTYRARMTGVKGLTKKLLTQLGSRLSPLRDLPGKGALDDEDAHGPWLLVDARRPPGDSGVKPALFPKILSENGEPVYDIAKTSESSLVQRGMAKYVVTDKDLKNLARVETSYSFRSLQKLFFPTMAHAKDKRKKRGKFIITKAKQVQGLMKTNIIISENDARKIREEDASTQVLKHCRVIIIAGTLIGGTEGNLLKLLAQLR